MLVAEGPRARWLVRLRVPAARRVRSAADDRSSPPERERAALVRAPPERASWRARSVETSGSSLPEKSGRSSVRAPPATFGLIDPSGRSSRPSPLRVTARCGSLRLPLQRLTACSQRTSTVARARPGSREVDVPYRGPAVTRVALSVALSAPASPFRTASRSSSSNLTSGTGAPEDPLLEFASSSEPNYVSAARAPGSSRPLARPRRPVELGKSPLLGFLLPRAHGRRVPLVTPTTISRSQQGGWRSPGPHRCRPQGSCPSRRFWLHSRHARAADPFRSLPARRSPWCPDASRPCSMPLAPTGVALQSFPIPRGAVPALAGLFSLVGSRRPPNGAARPEGFTTPFPVAPTSRRSWPEGLLDWKAGTTVPWSR